MTDPPGARVRIMNIAPPYVPGIRLPPGSYDILVSHPEYVNHREWLRLGRTDRVKTVTLKKIDPVAVATLKRDNIEMVRIPGGCFQMGSPRGEDGRYDDEKQHKVCVAPFLLAKYEVTVAGYRQFRKAAPGEVVSSGCRFWDGAKWQQSADRDWRDPGYPQTDNDPVACVSWNDAMAYIRWLNRSSTQTYRLPTEAEWEYAARGGEPAGARFWGNDPNKACKFANGADLAAQRKLGWQTVHQCDDGFVYTAPVQSPAFKPNQYGLYHMLGNVLEWTCSAYAENYNGSREKDCTSGGALRVLRGGSWINKPRFLRSAFRDRNTADAANDNVGFRLARTP